ncbi:MAG: amidase [Rhodobacteraceae bacterium]|nr:MAG: amidase [Paracoccaceae bacterium]
MTLAANPGALSALAAAIADGSLTPRALVESRLARIADVDGAVQAWRVVDADGARAAADALGAEAQAGRLRGPLHGVPFAVKDVIDVAGLPTRANSPSRADAAPARLDATVVARLRALGAIPLGKVHTTEFAYFESVPPTRNPHDLSRTPGGSSGGSAAAVAAGMVPFALGTQTAGSVSRPAAYCGVGAFKPSTLSAAGWGVTPLAPSFDTVGAFAATAADAALVVGAFAPEGARMASSEPPEAAEVVQIEDATIAEKASPAALAAVEALGRRLEESGLRRRRAPSPAPFAEAAAAHRTIFAAELGRVHAGLLSREGLIAPRLAADIRAGLATPDADYGDALATLIAMRRRFWSALPWPALVLLPAAPGPAPEGVATGDPAFISPMTALGGPIASIPAGFCPETGAPLGAMLCAAPGEDGRLAAAVRRLGL